MDKLKNKKNEKRAIQEDGITTFLSNCNNIANAYIRNHTTNKKNKDSDDSHPSAKVGKWVRYCPYVYTRVMQTTLCMFFLMHVIAAQCLS